MLVTAGATSPGGLARDRYFFAPGVTTQTISVPILSTVDDGQTFDVTISDAVNATIDPAKDVGTVTIDSTP